MMIIISHSLISYLLYRQNPERFLSSSDVQDRENEEKINEQVKVGLELDVVNILVLINMIKKTLGV